MEQRNGRKNSIMYDLKLWRRVQCTLDYYNEAGCTSYLIPLRQIHPVISFFHLPSFQYQYVF